MYAQLFFNDHKIKLKYVPQIGLKSNERSYAVNVIHWRMPVGFVVQFSTKILYFAIKYPLSNSELSTVQ